MTYIKNYSACSLEVKKVLRELKKEEAISNLSQANLGKRVNFNEKAIGCTCSLEIVEDSVLGNIHKEECIEYSDPKRSPKEKLISKIAKQPN